MSIKKIKVEMFETEDGCKFDTIEAARQHNLEKSLRELANQPQLDLLERTQEHIVDFILVNKTDIYNILVENLI